MKGKTKGERKNKSIKKNQIPAFILTGGEWDEKNPAGKMTEAVTHVEKLIENCKGQNVILINQQKDLIGKLQILKSQIDGLNLDEYERLKNEKSDIDGKMEKLNIDKQNLVSQIEKLTTENQQIEELQKKIKDAEQAKRDEDLKKEQAASLISQGMVPQITSQATETVSKIQMLTDKLSDNETEISTLQENLAKKVTEINDLKGEQIKMQADLDEKTTELGQKTTEMNTYLELLKTTYESLMDLTGTDSGEEPQLFKDESGNNINVEGMFNAMKTKLDTATQVSQASIAEKEQEIASNKENIARLEADKIAAEKKAYEAEARAKTAQENADFAQQSAKDAEDSYTASTAALEQQCQEKLITELTKAEGKKKEELEAAQAKNDEALARAKEELAAAQEELVAVQTELSAEKEATEAAQKEKAEAEAAKTELAAEKQKYQEALEAVKAEKELVENAKTLCEEQLLDKKKELSAIEPRILALEHINGDKENKLTDLEKKNTELQIKLDDTIDLNNKLVKASETHDVSVKQLRDQLNNSISKEDCDILVENARKGTVAGEHQAAQDMEPKYDENEIPKSIDIKTVEENDLKKDLNADDITILSSSIESITKPLDGPDENGNIIDDMDYKIKRNHNNVKKHFKNNLMTGERNDYHLNTYTIDTGMLFLFVHDKIKPMNDNIDDNRQIYICRIENIDNNNITADCWNISTSMNEFLKKYHEEQFKIDKLKKEDFQKYSVTINQHDSKKIKFSTIPHKGNHKKKLPEIYKELLTPIIHKGVVIDKGKNQNQNIYLGNHAYNGNLSGNKEGKLIGIKNQNIIPVYPYEQDSFQLLRRSTDNSSFQNSKNYIIYLTNYEKIIQKEDKNKYFPVIKIDDNKFTMFFRKDAELRYLHTLIEYAKTHTFLKQGDITALNTYAETGFQKQQNDKPPQKEKTLEQQEQTPQQNVTRRLLNDLEPKTSSKNPTSRIGGKKNLNKEYMKGGYRYSALGMKGLTIDLSGLKGKKTRRVKKKGKTVKNKKGSRKVKKGSRKDKTKKNKRRGRTYRNKNNYF